MIGSVPLVAADVLRAELAERQRAAEAHWDRDAMRRELGASRLEARRARRRAVMARVRQRSAARMGHFLRHGSTA